MGSVDAIEALLAEAEQAHGTYEATVLQGVYDQDWPRWYAGYAVEHGVAEITGHLIPVDQLAALLTTSWDDYQREHPDRAVSWASYTARRIAAES